MKLIYFLLLICTLTACATLKSDQFIDGQIPLSSRNISLLNGAYTSASTNESKDPQGSLFWNFYNRGFTDQDSLCSVTLKVIDEKHLQVILLKRDSVIKSKTLKGKLKNGYLEMNRQKLIIPAIFLNIFRTSKFRIGLLENSNLTTDYQEVAWGTGFFVIPFYDRRTEQDIEYPKK